MNKQFNLSKTTVLRSIQCQKSLYLHINKPHLKNDITANEQKNLDDGTAVGLLARELFPNGVDVSTHQNKIDSTKDLLAKKTATIYEATFEHDNVTVMVDNVVKDHNNLFAYEVKSTTSIKEHHIKDAAIQYYILHKSGYTPVDFFIVHINKEYVLDDSLNINIDELFTKTSVLSQILDRLSNVEHEIHQAKTVTTETKEPIIDIGPHCKSPHECDFKNYCWNHVPENSVLEISRGGKKSWALYNEGIHSISAIPSDRTFTALQQPQIDGVKNGKVTIDVSNISSFCGSLQYPISFLDFETISNAIPKYKQSYPYQQVPFQYSLHVLESDGTVTHKEFIAEPDSADPRLDFISNLLAYIPSKGTILTYNKSFETKVLLDLVKAFPAADDEVNKIIERIADLMLPFQKKWYYTPDMRGSYSIKKILPAVVPGMSYDNLEINAGDQASYQYSKLIGSKNLDDWPAIKKNLLEYCKLDTYSMVKILEVLEKV